MPKSTSKRSSADATTATLGYTGLGEMFDNRILGTDSAHVFFVSAQALAAHSKVVAEVGCGRGAAVEMDQPGGPWQDLRGEGRTVIGIDVEDAGLENPVIDEFRLIGPDGRWPLDDASVDLAVSDYVLEHVTDPDAFVRELARVLRPGGTFIGRTVSRRSALSVVARIVPNERHAGALSRLQPDARGAGRVPHRLQDEHPPGPGARLRRRLRVGAGEPHRPRAVLQALAAPAPHGRRGGALPAAVDLDGARRLRPPPTHLTLPLASLTE